MKSYLLLMMGGSGTRMGADIPKQFLKVADIPTFVYIVKGYERVPDISGIIIVVHPEWLDYVDECITEYDLKNVLAIVPGGVTRSNSVKNGLESLKDFAEANDAALFHDATHPYVDLEGTRGVIEALREYRGATLGEYQYDTVYEIDDNDIIVSTLNRKHVVAGASPEGFRFKDIYKIYSEASQEVLENMTSAGAIAIENGIEMKVIPCNTLNLKITYPNDLDVFNKTAKSYFFREYE